MLKRSAPVLGGAWHANYTAPREAGMAEVIAALTYEGLDPMARGILARVIVSEASGGAFTTAR